jgi:hypothetical protein
MWGRTSLGGEAMDKEQKNRILKEASKSKYSKKIDEMTRHKTKVNYTDDRLEKGCFNCRFEALSTCYPKAKGIVFDVERYAICDDWEG